MFKWKVTTYKAYYVCCYDPLTLMKAMACFLVGLGGSSANVLQAIKAGPGDLLSLSSTPSEINLLVNSVSWLGYV